MDNYGLSEYEDVSEISLSLEELGLPPPISLPEDPGVVPSPITRHHITCKPIILTGVIHSWTDG